MTVILCYEPQPGDIAKYYFPKQILFVWDFLMLLNDFEHQFLFNSFFILYVYLQLLKQHC